MFGGGGWSSQRGRWWFEFKRHPLIEPVSCGEHKCIRLLYDYSHAATLHRSTHNTCIERLWVEIGVHFAQPWHAFFSQLGRLHHLDHSDPHHLWLLHYLFLSEINADCAAFCEEWNAHPISGEGHDQSPNVGVTIL